MLAPIAMALLGDIIHSKDLGKAMRGYSPAVVAGIFFIFFILLGALSLALMTLIMKLKGKSSGGNLKRAWIGFLKALRSPVIFLAGIIGFIAFVIRRSLYLCC